jgi:peptidoglycan hydrolase-like protein with peptidoglycan-binding domain|tara:strand:- start:3440 stop:5536 length:2097 start_codon:yes stop_codon:yes gene_type:complete
MLKNFLKSLLVVLVFLSCGSSDEALETIPTEIDSNILDTTTSIYIEETTTTIINANTECVEDDNTTINLEITKNVQIFLNKYGFNAGEEDGYLGQQTSEAIREFQAYAGLNPDGDVGPNTIEKMNSWTGCEEKVNTYNTTTTTIPSDTTTTTTIPSDTTTTTTIPIDTTTNVSNNDYGIVPNISLTNNEVINIFKGVNFIDDVCGTPYLNNLDSNILNYYSNGDVANELEPINTVSTESSHTTEIVEESSNQIKIKIFGDGGTGYKFYFIEPFGSNLIFLEPSSLSTSLNLTEAVFDISNLTTGVWFYSFAESGNGSVVKSSGNREFVANNSNPQSVNSHNGIGKLIMTTKDSSTNFYSNVSSGQSFSTTSSLNIVYITDQILDNRQNTSNEINKTDTSIILQNENQAFISEILLVGTELMKVIDKNGNTFTVERGFLNTEIKNYEVGTQVKAITNINRETIVSNYAYAVFKNEKGMRFQIPLGPELSLNTFSFSNCSYDRYSLEEITTFSWRSSGSSTVSSTTSFDTVSPLFDKAFVVNSGGQNYTPPSISSTDEVSGDFANDGPRNRSIQEGDIVSFNFGGIIDGSSQTKFVKLKFKLVPDIGNTKNTKIKNVYFTIKNNNYIFDLNIRKVSSRESYLSDTWENGYKYIFQSITLYDSSTAVEIVNNGKIIYDYSSQQESHNVYYLDQFSFVIKSN